MKVQSPDERLPLLTKVTLTYVQTTFCVKGEGGIGTAFGVQVDGRQQLITARHNLGKACDGNNVFVRAGGSWKEFMLRDVRHSPDADVSVFDGTEIGIDFPTTGTSDYNLGLGDQVKFLGFPHGLSNTYDSDAGFQTPLIRNAFLSGAVEMDGNRMLVLDGFNNPGYSGAPVWYSVPGREELNLLGVVSGYRVEERSKSAVFEDVGGGAERKLPNLFVKPNSGMIHVVPYKSVMETLI